MTFANLLLHARLLLLFNKLYRIVLYCNEKSENVRRFMKTTVNYDYK